MPVTNWTWRSDPSASIVENAGGELLEAVLRAVPLPPVGGGGFRPLWNSRRRTHPAGDQGA